MVNVNGRKRNSFTFGNKAERLTLPCPRCNGTGKIEADSISIGDRFLVCRQRLKLTQAELAPKLGISRAQLANLEGDRSRPGLEMLVKAADVLGVSVDHLLGRETR